MASGAETALTLTLTLSLRYPRPFYPSPFGRLWLSLLQIARWLVRARARDVAVVDVRGRGGGTTATAIIATGASQRHAYACGEAVRYQVGGR